MKPSPSGRRQDGFTLLELLVVVAILALVYALAAPRLGAGLPGVQARAAARDLVAVFQEGRSLALTEQREVTVTVDAEARRLSLDGRPQALHGDVAIDADDAGEPPFAVRFYPDGSSSGIDLGVSRKAQRYNVHVDWLTGRVALQRESDDG